MLAQYMPLSCVSLSRLSVTLRYCIKTAKRITQTTPRESSLLMQKISMKFERGHPNRDDIYRWGR